MWYRVRGGRFWGGRFWAGGFGAGGRMAHAHESLALPHQANQRRPTPWAHRWGF
jgi:hypothetical protein